MCTFDGTNIWSHTKTSGNVALDESKLCVNYIHAVWLPVLLPLLLLLLRLRLMLELILLLLLRHFSYFSSLFCLYVSFHSSLKFSSVQFSSVSFILLTMLCFIFESECVNSSENWRRKQASERTSGCVRACALKAQTVSTKINSIHKTNDGLPSERVKNEETGRQR